MNIKLRTLTLLALLAPIALVSCAATNGSSDKGENGTELSNYKVVGSQTGKMSWYSIKTNRGTTTASGEKLCDRKPTAAHRNLKMGTLIRVTNLNNGKSEILRVNDRGPFTRGRIVDVAVGMAQPDRLGFYQQGVAPCKVEILEPTS